VRVCLCGACGMWHVWCVVCVVWCDVSFELELLVGQIVSRKPQSRSNLRLSVVDLPESLTK
jgi:hypothetical protein